jgi:hypothetical protein
VARSLDRSDKRSDKRDSEDEQAAIALMGGVAEERLVLDDPHP